MLELSSALTVDRFVHGSTAYSSGYIEGRIGESLHAEPASDPTEYTRTKRAAERRVAETGVPYLIIRPSVVIGDSRTGRHTRTQTGLFQHWIGWGRPLLDPSPPRP